MSGDHPIAALLTAAAAPDGLDLSGVAQRLAGLSRCGARVQVIPGELRWGGERFADFDGPQGLTGFLSQLGVAALVFWPHLTAESLTWLLSAPRRAHDLRDVPLEGLGLEIPGRAQRSRAGVEALVHALARDPESGVDLLSLSSPGAHCEQGIPTGFGERLREHLGVARLASLEADLRRSLRTDAIRLHASERGIS